MFEVAYLFEQNRLSAETKHLYSGRTPDSLAMIPHLHAQAGHI